MNINQAIIDELAAERNKALDAALVGRVNLMAANERIGQLEAQIQALMAAPAKEPELPKPRKRRTKAEIVAQQ